MKVSARGRAPRSSFILRPSSLDSPAFTLLELLVATAMMSVLVLSLFATLRVAYRARDTALGAVGPARAGEAAMDLIRRDIESALPPTGQLAGPFIGAEGTEAPGTSGLVFSAVGNAAPGYLEAVAAAGGGMASSAGSGGAASGSDATLAGGLIRVAYTVTQRNTSMVLVRQVQRNLLAQVESSEADEESVVCRGVRSFTLSYYDGEQWLDTWDSSQQGNALPMAVEITLELERPPSPGALANAGAADRQPYVTTRIVFPSCYDASAAATGGLP
jgi:type II secretory pathway pseudopilin PulG